MLPEVEHRWCACHIYVNWSKKHRKGELKKKLWKDAWSTFDKEFLGHKKELGEMSYEATRDLMK